MALLCLASTLALQGCATWRPVTPASPTELPDHLRITLRSGEEVELRDARLQGDTLLVGRTADEAPVAISLEDIRQVEGRTRTVGGTAAVLAWSAIPAGIVLLFLFLASLSGADYT